MSRSEINSALVYLAAVTAATLAMRSLWLQTSWQGFFVIGCILVAWLAGVSFGRAESKRKPENNNVP